MATKRASNYVYEPANPNSNDRLWMLVLLGSAVVFMLLLIWGLFALAGSQSAYKAELILPMLLCLGTALLILILAFVTVIFQWLGLANPIEPLALPAGSVRSVIALSLILIFIMTSLFLFAGLGQSPSRQSSGLTAEEVKLLPQAQIVSINQTTVMTGTNTPLYTVEIRDTNQAAEDIAKQTLTVVSTLVVAVAGFYFGSRSVEVATKSTRGDSSRSTSIPKITDINPSPAVPDDRIFVFGDNFGEPAAGNAVMVHDLAGVFVQAFDSEAIDIEWQDSRIGLQLPPEKMSAGNRYLFRVVAGSRVSDPKELALVAKAPPPTTEDVLAAPDNAAVAEVVAGEEKK